jgi:hypothetical protein
MNLRWSAHPTGLLAALGLILSACGPHSEPATPADSGAPDVVAPTDGGPDQNDPSKLSAPANGQGVQLMTDAFTVPASTELQICYFFKVSDLAMQAGLDPSKPLDVHRVEIVQRPGTHHMNLFRVRTIKNLDPAMGARQVGTNGMGQCFVSSNWSDWPLIANTQQDGRQDWSYPDGVVNELEPTETLMLQTHYVNAQTQGTPDGVGQVAINLWTIDPSAVTAQIGTLFATNQQIRVCKDNPTPTFSAGCQFNSPNPVTIIGANGHFHSRGTQFDIYSWDGTTPGTPPDSQRFYQSLTWNEPPMLHSPDLTVQVPAMGGVVYSCSYDWQDPATETQNALTCANLDAYDMSKPPATGPAPTPDCCYRFGPQVDLNEHCNAFVYYYPKQDNVTCF